MTVYAHRHDCKNDAPEEMCLGCISARYEELEAEIERLREALKASVATIDALYEHLERVEKAGGATSLEGVAACHIMLKSMRKNANRVEELVMKPARAALKGDE